MLNTIDMSAKTINSWIFLFFSCALLAIGRVYDERLEIADINLGIFLSVIYLVSVIFMLFSIKKTILSKSKVLFYSFYLLALLMTPILWLVFDVTDYGFEKAINFWLIVIPISVVIAEKYERKDVLNTFYILLAVTCLLALLSFFGPSITERADGRMTALGGGPIVFARWMGFGIITLLFLPVKIKYIYKYSLILIFFILALATGSRGPILGLFLTGFVYVFLNFNRVIVRISLGVFLLISVLVFSGVEKQIAKLGNSKRVFMNISKKGGSKQSTSTRTNLAIGSFLLLQNYPLGVGAGNWQVITNKLSPTHLMPLEYPHNLVLEVACEYGIQTVLLLLLLFLYVFHLSYHKMIKYKNDKTSFYLLLFYLFLFFFFNSLVSGMLNDSRLLFVVISCIIIHKPLISTNE
ncbi:MAG: O-antigen ligase family protein [Flavobacteriales bacterium]|nr:O-antigen ligase family protein [Flavobacteriales bacterium]